MKSILFTILIISLNYSFSFGKPPDWFAKFNQIKLFKSNRSEVENLFKPFKITYQKKFDSNEWLEYETKAGTLTVFYSAGKCSLLNNKGYNADDGVVIGADFSPEKLVRITKFKIDLSRLKSYEGSDTNHVFYESEDSTLKYQTINEKLQGIEFSPTDAETEIFDCERILKSK